MMKKKILAILLIVLMLTQLCGCDKIRKDVASFKQHVKDSEFIKTIMGSELMQEAGESIDKVKEKLNDYDDPAKDIELEKLLEDGKSLIEYIDFTKGTAAKEAMSGAMEVMKEWISPIGFSGYMTHSSGFSGSSFLPEDSYVQHSIDFCFEGESKYIDYKVTFKKDFEKIDADRLLLRLNAIFGADIDEKEFKDKLNEFQSTVHEMDEKKIESHTVYDKDKVLIQLSKIYDGENRYISISASYNKPTK
jgi:hypothetical protein